MDCTVRAHSSFPHISQLLAELTANLARATARARVAPLSLPTRSEIAATAASSAENAPASLFRGR